MDKNARIVLFGFLTWLLPFVASFLFFDPQAQKLTIDETFFKSIMIVLSSLIGVCLLIKHFSAIRKDYVREGVIVGACWIAINWALDAVVLLPMMNVDFTAYFMQIGLRYLMIPIISVGMAAAAADACGKKG
ncbi:MAG: hypothetical protein V1861_05985 [Candidatus Micrarchaeota archaeon]